MKKTRSTGGRKGAWSAVACTLLVLALAYPAGATHQVISQSPPALVDYFIDFGSFSTLSTDTEALKRVIEVGATSWGHQAQSHQIPRFAGGCSGAGCAGKNVIEGNDGCSTLHGCSVSGWTTPWPDGNYTIDIFKISSNNYTLTARAGGDVDFQSLVSHEFGHSLLFDNGSQDHIEPEVCNMNATTGFMDSRDKCKEEIDMISDPGTHSAGWEMFSMRLFINGSDPNLVSQWSTPLTQSISEGMGGIAMSRSIYGQGGSDFDLFYRTDQDYQPLESPYAPSVSYTAQVRGSQIAKTSHRQTVAWDFLRGNLWSFWVDDSLSLTNESRIDYSISYDNGATWSRTGEIAFGSGSGQFFSKTRNPVGVAYDRVSDSMILVYTNFDVPNEAPPGNSTTGWTSELLAVSISAASPTVRRGPVQLTNQTAFGPPVVACENDSSISDRCEVLYTGTDSHRHIWSNRIIINASGVITGVTGGLDTGGWTNFPIGLTYNGVNRTGKFVGAHAGNDGNLYVMTKSHIRDSWSGWFRIFTSTSSNPPNHPVMGGPVVSYLENSPSFNYHLFVR